MLMFDPLFEARERARRLRAEAAAERLRPPTARRLVAKAPATHPNGAHPTGEQHSPQSGQVDVRTRPGPVAS